MPETPLTSACAPSRPSVPTSLATRVTSAVERTQLIERGVDGVLELEDLALRLDGDLLRQIAVRDRRRDGGDVPDLGREVAGQPVHAVGELLPHARHAANVGLRAQLALGPDLAGDADHLGGERPQLIDGCVDGVLELEDLAASLDGDLLRQVAIGDGGGDERDVSHLSRQVAGEQVHVVDEFLPRAGQALDAGLTAELPLGAHLADDARNAR